MTLFKELAISGAIGAVLASSPSLAETVKFKAELTSGDEVPKTESSGTGSCLIPQPKTSAGLWSRLGCLVM